MKVKVVSRKLIKPCIPTPTNLNKYKISVIDEIMPPMNLSVLLFYPPNPKPKPKQTTQILQESLAKILPHFYPLAGRYIKKDQLVDCNDEGAEFVEARVFDEEMMDVIAKTKNEDQLNDLLSRQMYEVEEATDPLLSVQITEFKCGGLVISVTVSHKVVDLCSIGTFVAAWSNNNNINDNAKVFEASLKLFPGKNLSCFGPVPRCKDPSIVVKRLLFNKEAIASLRSKLIRPMKDGHQGLFSMSRVRVVTAVIAKAFIGMDQAKNNGKLRDCFIAHAVDMRNRTTPPLPKHTCGNFAILSLTKCIFGSEKEVDNNKTEELVYLVGDGINKTISDCAELLSLDDDGVNNMIIDPMVNLMARSRSGEVHVVWFTDWSKIRLYEADFGWGKPVWAGIGTAATANITVLMDTKEGDGIEAWVHLEQNEVPYFEQDEDMNLFTIT